MTKLGGKDRSMNTSEHELFWCLCRFLDPDRERIAALLQAGAGTPAVLGQLLYNRMAGVAYHVLTKTVTQDLTSREFRNILRDVRFLSIEKNQSFVQCRNLVTDILEKSDAEYALLKGAYLCELYPPGCRTANDVDVLTEGKWITAIGNALQEAGFRQGYLKGGMFVPASRKEIIHRKITRGETVPYFLEVGLPYMPYLEVDINFSLDYKNTIDTALPAFVSEAALRGIGANQCRTLSDPHFLLHLCMHLYKEATTYPWVQMGRDMNLYKFCDLYVILMQYTLQDYKTLAAEAEKHGLLAPCCWVLSAMQELFGTEDPMLLGFLARYAPENLQKLDRVVDPAGKREFVYENMDLRQRFFAGNRVSLLREVQGDA